MAGAIQVDPNWIADYAKAAEQAGDDLAAALRALQGTPLSAASFGQIGQTVGSTAAYHGASATLQEQVGRAADALHSAATNLRGIASQHSSADDEQARSLKSVHQN